MCEMFTEFCIFHFLISEISSERGVWACVAIAELPRLMHFDLSAARDLLCTFSHRCNIDIIRLKDVGMSVG